MLRLATNTSSAGISQLNKDFRSVFILSAGRTGTTYLAERLNHTENVLALHEPKPSRLLRMWSSAHLEGLIDPADMESVLYTYRKKLLDNSNQEVYIESNPYLVGFSDVILKVFPESIIIHIIRDPRDYIKSALNHGNTSGIKNILNNYLPYWYADVDTALHIQTQGNLILRTAAYWTLANRYIADNFKNYENYHVIKFEDLFKDPKLKSLSEIIGVKISPSTKNNRNISKDSKIQDWTEWEQYEVQGIHNICKNVAANYDYLNDSAWLKIVNQKTD